MVFLLAILAALAHAEKVSLASSTSSETSLTYRLPKNPLLSSYFRRQKQKKSELILSSSSTAASSSRSLSTTSSSSTDNHNVTITVSNPNATIKWYRINGHHLESNLFDMYLFYPQSDCEEYEDIHEEIQWTGISTENDNDGCITFDWLGAANNLHMSWPLLWCEPGDRGKSVVRSYKGNHCGRNGESASGPVTITKNGGCSEVLVFMAVKIVCKESVRSLP